MTIESLAKFLRDEMVAAMKQDPSWKADDFRPWHKETDRKKDIYRKVAQTLMEKYPALKDVEP